MSGSMIQLQEQDILLDLKARNKEGALKELAGVLHKHCPHLKIATLYQVLRDRELIGSTGVGNGVAIPHGKVEGLNRILLGFGRSRNGISYESIDNQPVHLLVMILSPVRVIDEYLKTLAGISRLLKQPEKRRALRTTESPGEVIDIFQQAE
jgi:PTS system nitrogen regulatory IIA component